MKTRRLNIKTDIKLRLQKIRKALAGVPLDDEEMSKVTGGCGGVCYITCSYYCEYVCEGSCMTSSTWNEYTGPGLYCYNLPIQNKGLIEDPL